MTKSRMKSLLANQDTLIEYDKMRLFFNTVLSCLDPIIKKKKTHLQQIWRHPVDILSLELFSLLSYNAYNMRSILDFVAAKLILNLILVQLAQTLSYKNSTNFFFVETQEETKLQTNKQFKDLWDFLSNGVKQKCLLHMN